MRRKESKNKENLKQARDTRKGNNVLSQLNKSVVVTGNISENEREIDIKEGRRRLEVSRKEEQVRRKETLNKENLKRMSDTRRENDDLFNRLRRRKRRTLMSLKKRTLVM